MEMSRWCWSKPGVFGQEQCTQAHINDTIPGLCPPVYDGYLCWGVGLPNSTVQLRCPRKPGNDVTQFAFRVCEIGGTWAQNPYRATFSEVGWTNYQPCFNNYTVELMRRLLGSSNSTDELMAKTNIAGYTRILEMVGLVVSALSLILALLIFGRFRNLRNNRTRIHLNLFIAMTIQVLVRLALYIDQYVDQRLDFECYTLQRMEYTCESAYTILEYAKTAMFLWMFNEGMYLHNMITVAVFQEHCSLTFHYFFGWGAPLLLTAIWTFMTASEFNGVACWLGYNFSSTYMVLEGPRLVVIFLNLIFLLNIVRVLVTKLRESNSTEAQQVRKAVRAAIVLLPLLGITNSIQMIHSPVEKSPTEFAVWSYGTTFLSTFQGFFCSLIYCFLNGEVQVQVRRYLRTKRQHKTAGSSHSKKLLPRISIISRIRRGNNATLRDDKIRDCQPSSSLPILETKLQGKFGTGQRDEECRRGGGGGGDGNDHKRRGNIDPFFESWDEAELSSHNNVIIELVEIPTAACRENGSASHFAKNCTIPPGSTSVQLNKTHSTLESSRRGSTTAAIPGAPDNNDSLKAVVIEIPTSRDEDDDDAQSTCATTVVMPQSNNKIYS